MKGRTKTTRRVATDVLFLPSGLREALVQHPDGSRAIAGSAARPC